jgi:hypothetical protein
MEHTTRQLARSSKKETSPGALRALWHDDRGFIISAELVMIATILVLGLIAGLACVRDAVTGELFDVADAIDSLNQSYAVTGMHGCWNWGCGRSSFTAGSCFTDYEENVQDECFFEGPCQARCEAPACPIEEHIVEPQVIEEPTPCVEPCPPPCEVPCPDPCATPCPPGTVYYYESGPSLSPQPIPPQSGVPQTQPGSAGQAATRWRPIAPVNPPAIW